MSQRAQEISLPGQALPIDKAPGHWVLARIGKRVLRPGGLELTRWMLSSLAIGSTDDVVEIAPGLGITARMTLRRHPRSYVALERDSSAADIVRRISPRVRCILGSAEVTGLPDECASVVYGEAMLSMQPNEIRRRVLREAFRLLRPGGRYGIHELCLTPDSIPQALAEEIHAALSSSIHAGVRPLTRREWGELLTETGFSITSFAGAPMHLLEPLRILQDEGVRRTATIAWNLVRDPVARGRVRAMRSVFRKYRKHLAAGAWVATKESKD